MTKAVIINSGGLDSTTLVYRAVFDGYDVITLSFDYGQRHSKELLFAQGTAHRLDLEWRRVDVSFLAPLFSNLGSHSVLVNSDHAVPDGHYAHENMKQTVVPNRNMIMLSIAAGVAISADADIVMAGMHAGDHFIYPDCRPRFVANLNAALVYGNEGFGTIREQPENALPDSFLVTPYIHMTKEEIAREAIELRVPLELTWSCYKGEGIHCGRCGTCVERIEAIQGAIKNWHPEFTDPTRYADTEFWKEQVNG
jgi:7-cyano-7-deazaguanine synthase